MIANRILEKSSRIKALNKYYSGIATIFMLHRVHPFEASKLSPNENMKVSPIFLENFILSLKADGYTFISIDSLYEMLHRGKSVEKKIVFTLDDGYRDNYEVAYPIFKRLGVPFTIYITTSFPDNNAILWWYILEDILIENNSITLGNDQTYICQSMQQKNKVFLEIRSIILKLDQKNLLSELKRLFTNYNHINWFAKSKELSLTWQQIKQLSSDELVTIAGHTKNHYAFNKLNHSEIVNEVTTAHSLIESHTSKKVEHFSYPFGSTNEVSESEINSIKSLNLKTATTTRRGNIYLKHQHYLSRLPRIMLTENFSVSDLGKIRRKRFVI